MNNSSIILDECEPERFRDLLRELHQLNAECSIEITRGSDPFTYWSGKASNPDLAKFPDGSLCIAFEIGTVSLELDEAYMYCFHQSDAQTILCAGIRPETDDGSSSYAIWINANH
ncbi:hypothetical protein KIH86_17830 [Paenibacillus sp. HN-1]|uniref:hypothetical protein n=1 Tax=Paenibacillus TaxID=44249 RepID=UPI001CA95E28|nr:MULTISPECIES: hypothetical protein [Paenibacillus]MBY9078270.1 hypothetical protein [Paenibacillus sp. CGMCC 1.18879]MBY9086071.1 hypothetical protein [Paenibacillus sinensis]